MVIITSIVYASVRYRTVGQGPTSGINYGLRSKGKSASWVQRHIAGEEEGGAKQVSDVAGHARWFGCAALVL